MELLKNKKATYIQANEFGVEVGQILSDVLGTHVTVDVLPDGKMYFNIADRLFNSVLKKNFDLISGYSTDVQSELNQLAGFKLKSQVPELNQDRIDGFVNRISSEDDFEKMVDIFMDNFRYDRHFADKKNIIASIAGIIHKGKGNINIAKIAEEVGYNQRYLDRVFKEAVGVSMKKYAEIIRIQKAIYYLQNSLTYEIYERLGYYDQAHFIKDFKKNTSLTPSRFERANSQYKIV